MKSDRARHPSTHGSQRLDRGELAGPGTFSVVIATRNRPGQLADCLRSIARQDYPGEAIEVVVIDDGGEEPLDDVVDAFRDVLDIRLLRQLHHGPAAARNRGARLARGEFLAFTDDDCRPRPDWLSRIMPALRQYGRAMAGGRTVNALHSNAFSSTSQMIVDRAYAYHNHRSTRFVASNNMVLPASAFHAVAGFDTSFRPASEDRDLCARWVHAGFEICFVHDAVVEHAHDLSLAGFVRQHFRYGRGARLYMEAMRRRGAISKSGWIREHLRFLCTFAAPLRRLRAVRQSTTVCVLAVWQLANLAGFIYQASLSVLGTVENRRPRPSTSTEGAE